jgi:arginyl-tRNA synthetase
VVAPGRPTLRELIDEVGRDAVRFFLVSRRADGEFAFDVDLAKSQTEDNPVYYVQYANARVCSVLEQWQAQYPDDARDPESADLAPLDSSRELHLMQRLGDFPDILETASREYAPHQIAFYLRELAGEFHSYYNSDRILVSETPTRLGRVALIVAIRQVLRNGLGLLGVTAPEKM